MTTDTEACNLASWHSSVSEITGAPIVYSALLTADVRGYGIYVFDLALL